MGPFGLGMVLYGGPFLDYWTIAGLLLAGPYCCPIRANLVLSTVLWPWAKLVEHIRWDENWTRDVAVQDR